MTKTEVSKHKFPTAKSDEQGRKNDSDGDDGGDDGDLSQAW